MVGLARRPVLTNALEECSAFFVENLRAVGRSPEVIDDVHEQSKKADCEAVTADAP